MTRSSEDLTPCNLPNAHFEDNALLSVILSVILNPGANCRAFGGTAWKQRHCNLPKFGTGPNLARRKRFALSDLPIAQRFSCAGDGSLPAGRLPPSVVVRSKSSRRPQLPPVLSCAPQCNQPGGANERKRSLLLRRGCNRSKER